MTQIEVPFYTMFETRGALDFGFQVAFEVFSYIHDDSVLGMYLNTKLIYFLYMPYTHSLKEI